MSSELTYNDKLYMSNFMVVILAYGPIEVHHNKYGERIQDWDEEGKKRAVSKGIEEGLVFSAYGSDEASAMATIENYKKSGNEVTRIEKLSSCD